MVDGFDPDVTTLNPFTINLFLMSATSDIGKVCKAQRQKLRRVFNKRFPDIQAKFVFDVAAVHSDQCAKDWPKSDIDTEYHQEPRTRNLAFVLHVHGFAAHPHISSDEIKEVFKEAYPGLRRVNCSVKRPTTTDPDGYLEGGDEGWGEYASLEKCDVDMDDDDPLQDNVAAVQSLTKLRLKWPRQSRRFSYGIKKKSSVSSPRSPKQFPSDDTDDNLIDCTPHTSFSLGDIVRDTCIDILSDIVDSTLEHLMDSALESIGRPRWGAPPLGNSCVNNRVFISVNNIRIYNYVKSHPHRLPRVLKPP